jgi:predicted transcriptional regulator
MTLHIELSSETAAKLRERAAATGKDVSSYARDAIEQRLASDDGNGAASAAPRQGGEEWFARFREWVAAHPPRPLLADDSRDAIYGEEPD